MNTVKLDKEKLNALRKKLNTTFTAMSWKIGRSDSFISKCIGLGYMNENAFAHMCSTFGVAEADMRAQDAVKQVTVEIPKHPSVHNEPYSVELTVKPDRVRVAIRHNGSEIYNAWSRIKSNSEVDLIQAISYAAHMCYKMAEQKSLSGK